MQESIGEIRTEFHVPKWDAFCCTINTTVGREGLVMGAGVARVFKEYFGPELAQRWGNRILSWHPKSRTYVLVEHLGHVSDHSLMKYAIGFPTKYDWKLSSPIDLIERSAKQLRILIEAMNWHNVLLPRPGCSNGGLSWAEVKPRLEPILDDRVTIISKN